MNRFQIIDTEGNAIPLKELDKQAAEFWGQDVHPKWYASPHGVCVGLSWYDCIGWNIANQGNKTSGWPNIVYSMCAENLGQCLLTNSLQISINSETIKDLYDTSEYYQPYLNLIRYWVQKGYQPVQIKHADENK